MPRSIRVQMRPKNRIPSNGLETHPTSLQTVFALLTVHEPAPLGRKLAVEPWKLRRSSRAVVASEIGEDGGDARVRHGGGPVVVRPEMVSNFVADDLDIFEMGAWAEGLEVDGAALDAGEDGVLADDCCS